MKITNRASEKLSGTLVRREVLPVGGFDMRWLVLCAAVGILVFGSAATGSITHHYTFDTNANDSGTVGGNHGTLTGDAAIVFDVQRGSGVLSLDGNGDYANLSAPNLPGPPTDTSIFTIAAWFRLDSVDITQNSAIYGEFTTSGRNRNKLGIVTDGVVHFDQYDPIAGNLRSASQVDDGRWHHVAYVQNEASGDKRKLYIDGLLDSSDNAPEAYASSSPTLFAIGARLGTAGGDIHGRIDDVRFYDTALSSTDVDDLFTSTNVIPEPTSLVICSVLATLSLSFYRGSRRRT